MHAVNLAAADSALTASNAVSQLDAALRKELGASLSSGTLKVSACHAHAVRTSCPYAAPARHHKATQAHVTDIKTSTAAETTSSCHRRVFRSCSATQLNVRANPLSYDVISDGMMVEVAGKLRIGGHQAPIPKHAA